MSASPLPLEAPLVVPVSPPPPPLPNILALPLDVATSDKLSPTPSSLVVAAPPKSFRETLIDGDASCLSPLVTYEELVAANQTQDAVIPMMEGGENPSKAKIPKVRIPKSIWEQLCAPWRNAVIIKLLGKTLNFHLLHARLLRLWRIEGEFTMIDVGLGYYIVKFSTPQDCSLVLTGGPYKMFHHYLAVQPWEPSFHPARAKAPKTTVWIKLFGVPMLCYEEAIVLYLGSKIGKPIKVDQTALLATRGQYARVCVEVDLSQQLPSSVDLELEELPQCLILVEYEGLYKICFHCGEFSHKEDFCRFKNSGQAPPIWNPNAKAMVELTPTLKPNMIENNMVYGPWMVQQRKNRQKAQQRQSQASPAAADQAPKITGTTSTVNGNFTNSAMNVQRGRNVGSRESGSNRFTAIADIMEGTDLLNSNAEKAVNVEGRANPTEALGPSTNLDATPIPNSEAQIVAQTQPVVSQAVNTSSCLPPAPTTSFVKPKSQKSKNKNKLVGPIYKKSKTPNQKPYEIPSVSRKQHGTEIMNTPPTHIINTAPLPLPPSNVETHEAGSSTLTTHQTSQASSLSDMGQSSRQDIMLQASPSETVCNGSQAALEAVTKFTSLSP